MRKLFFILLPISLLMLSCQEEKEQTTDTSFYVEEKSTIKDSIQWVEEQLASDPDNITLLLQLGRLCKEKFYYNCALNAGAKAFRLDSTRLDARALYAWTLINKPEPPLADIERAKRHYKYILSITPNDPETMVHLANTYSFLGDFETSFKLINDALRINDRFRDAYVLKGTNYGKAGNYEFALSSYQTAVQIDPEYFMGHLQIGYLLTNLERHELAIEYYQNAVNIDPTSIEALYGIAKSYQDLGAFEEAQHHYREILAIDPKFYIAYFNQGFLKHYGTQELDSAVYYYNLCIDVQPESVRAWHNLGEAYFAQGRKADAARAFSEALTLNPDFEPTLEAKEKLR